MSLRATSRLSSGGDELRGNLFELCALALLGIAFLGFALAKGIPALRHDWAWPADPQQFRIAVLDAAGAWSQSGIGAPNPRPSTYLLAPFLLVGNMLGGPLLALVVLLTAIVTAIISAARVLVAGTTARPVRTALTAFLLFNPWVYVELVAGHLAMLLAYGCIGVVIGTAIRPQSRPHTLALASIGALVQIQFGMLGMAIALVRLAREKRFIPAAIIIICASPMLLGIALDGDYLRAIPVTPIWESTQSVTLPAAVVLSGYFTHYDSAIEPSGGTLVAIVILFAIGALARSRFEAVLGVAFVAGGTALLLMSGSKGPLAPLYAHAFQSFVPVRAFRELYDLGGLVALAYTFLASRFIVPQRFVPLAVLLAIAFPAVWLLAPPNRFWIGTSELPAAALPDVAPGTRIALLPAFQPMMFDGRGSGADPDYYGALQRAPVINQYFPDAIVAAAFAASAHGDARPLRRLAVSTVVFRSWLHGDSGSLAQQGLALPVLASAASSRTGAVASIVALVGKPHVELDPSVGNDGIFVADAAPVCGACAHAMHVIAIPRTLEDPSGSWVDVADAIVAIPQMWQPLGGAVTSSTLPLMLRTPHSGSLLVRVEGRLTIDGSVARAAPATFTWIAVAAGLHRIVCAGVCSVVGTIDDLPRIVSTPRSRPQALVATWLAPWFLQVTLPKGSSNLLRLLVRYDPHWIAFAGTHIMPHVAVDTVFNGWLVPDREHVATVTVFNSASVAQTLLEFIALLSLLVYAGRRCIARSRYPARHSRR